MQIIGSSQSNGQDRSALVRLAENPLGLLALAVVVILALGLLSSLSHYLPRRDEPGGGAPTSRQRSAPLTGSERLGSR